MSNENILRKTETKIHIQKETLIIFWSPNEDRRPREFDLRIYIEGKRGKEKEQVT